MIRPAVLLLLAVSLLLASAGSPAAQPEPKKPDAFDGRTKGKARLLKEFGGSEESEEAVMLGLAWLTQVQKKDGSWVYDGSRPEAATLATPAATGMALLAFLGAGQSHKEGRYQLTVQAGLDWLVNKVNVKQGRDAGLFPGADQPVVGMYIQGIATLALCEAYGLTQDKNLRPAAQAAIDYIQRAQAANGSWGYTFGIPGDTSIVGWQIQALHAAQLTQDLRVDDRVIKKAIAFLNLAAGGGQNKSTYGYRDNSDAARATSRTAIGLLCRYYIDGWRADNPGFAEGTKGLMTRAPSATAAKPQFDLYYYYYATQVVRFHGGEEWKTWNEGAKNPGGSRSGGVPDWIIGLQVRTPSQRGSWDPPADQWMGPFCGRLGTTALCLLTLEVYYRYSPEELQNEPKKP